MQFASTLDLLPTIFNLVGATIPSDCLIDGYDMAPILFKRGQVCGFTHTHMYSICISLEFMLALLSVSLLSSKLVGSQGIAKVVPPQHTHVPYSLEITPPFLLVSFSYKYGGGGL